MKDEPEVVRGLWGQGDEVLCEPIQSRRDRCGMAFSSMVGYRTTTTPRPLFGQFLEGVFSETHIQHRAQEPPSPGPSIVAIDARGCLLPGAEGATRSHLLVGGAAPLPALASPSFPGGGGGSGR